MPGQPLLSSLALAVAAIFMVAELWLSRRHERALLARGAVQPPDPVYPMMRWAYPAAFVTMAAEGAIVGAQPGTAAVAGLVVFALGKALKLWAIAILGERWTYRVFVLPDAPLVTRGPYRLMRHPNYVGVVGELVGMALVTGARVAGPLAIVFFSWLLWNRIVTEERALSLR